MKKVLTLLTSFSLIATSSVLVVSCKNDGLKDKLEKPKDISDHKDKNEKKSEKNDGKTPHDMNQMSQSDEGQGEKGNRSNSDSSNINKNNIFSSAEDEKFFIYGYNKWLEGARKGNAEHIINPDNPNEILLLGFTKENKGKEEVYKLKQIPTNVNKVPKWLPLKVTSLEEAFKNNISEKIDGIEFWDTSKITNMYQTFYGAKKFNQDISNWKTNNVDNMNYMFFDAESFKGDLSKWKVPKSFYSQTFDKYSGIQGKTQLLPQFNKPISNS
ncbi:BspA family leucine-rich repeat surface protein [Mycoplasma mycoides]|uniref:BspA family leucine-rich repeat surface protein n=1 Tax=Mycoplasma mycoides TaxID=2102 RepID=UPI00223E9D80|nr:BspA family leucine-rich repeat surface protein [Mycoplasma mycoides]QVK05401.1 BspA family leucine-rich repeat surface protein [Mycoplasma mycoides subsp. capri]